MRFEYGLFFLKLYLYILYIDIFSGLDTNTDYNRLFDAAKVMETPNNPNRTLIAFNRKVDTDILEIFKTREINHRQM